MQTEARPATWRRFPSQGRANLTISMITKSCLCGAGLAPNIDVPLVSAGEQLWHIDVDRHLADLADLADQVSRLEPRPGLRQDAAQDLLDLIEVLLGTGERR